LIAVVAAVIVEPLDKTCRVSAIHFFNAFVEAKAADKSGVNGSTVEQL
jgi:hypothetical protein